MQSPQFREIIADYNGFKLTTKDFSNERLEKVNGLLKNVLPKAQHVHSYKNLCGISQQVEETKKYVERINKINIDEFKVTDVFVISGLFAGGELVVRENGLAELIIFGSGRPVVGYTVGYITGPDVTGSCTVC